MTPQALALATYQNDEEVLAAQTHIRTVADKAREIVIVDAATNRKAEDMMVQCRKAAKALEAQFRARYIDRLTAQVNDARADLASMVAPAKEADRILTQKTSQYRVKCQEAVRKEEERDRLLAERRQERAAEKAEERGLEPPIVIPRVPAYAPPAKTVETDSGAKITYRKTPHMEITNPDAVPRNFCVPNPTAIRAALVNGIVPEIPGVKFWYTEEPSVR